MRLYIFYKPNNRYVDINTALNIRGYEMHSTLKNIKMNTISLLKMFGDSYFMYIQSK